MGETPSSSELAILIPAAGASSRMRGTDKLLEDVGDIPLIQRQAQIALRTGMQVYVTLPPAPSPRHSALEVIDDDNLIMAACDDAAEGLSASIRAGARWAQESHVQGLMILLADLPDITSEDLDAMIMQFAATPQSILRACSAAGNPGHPVIFPKDMFHKLRSLTGDHGAGNLLKQEKVTLVPLPDEHATTDLDTPEEWAVWRQQKR